MEGRFVCAQIRFNVPYLGTKILFAAFRAQIFQRGIQSIPFDV